MFITVFRSGFAPSLRFNGAADVINRMAYPIHNCTLISFVRSLEHDLWDIHDLLVKKLIELWCLYELNWHVHFCFLGKNVKNIHFSSKKNFHVIDQVKSLRVSLWIDMTLFKKLTNYDSFFNILIFNIFNTIIFMS